MRPYLFAIGIGLLASIAPAQSQKAASVFESAEIRPSPHVWDSVVQGGLFRSGRYEIRQATLLDLIKTAYQVDPDTIFGGPPWLDGNRFDVVAKAAPSTSQEAARLMLRNRLADRFQLTVHEDKKPLPAFVLSRGKGPLKMTPAEDSTNPVCRAVPPPKGPPEVPQYIAGFCRGVTMEAFAAQLRVLSAEYVQYPVLNTTGLEGAWDFDFRWTPKGPLMGGLGGTSLFDALQSQLGIRLEAQTIPLPVLVVLTVIRKQRLLMTVNILIRFHAFAPVESRLWTRSTYQRAMLIRHPYATRTREFATG